MTKIDKSIKDLKQLFSEQEILIRVKELASDIENIFPPDETIYAVCVLKGSFMFASDLVKYIKRNVKMEFIRVSSYGNETKSGGSMQALDLTLPDLNGENVLIIEDIIDTGLTAQFLIDMFKLKHQPKKLVFVSLLNKKCARKISIEPDLYGFEIDNKFAAGYGMDYKGYFRNLPYIGCFDV